MSRFCETIGSLPWPIPCHTGLNALRKRDKRSIQCQTSPNALSSVDLDTGLSHIFPQAPRWDYGIACDQPSLCVIWVEVHPATSGEVRKVARKLKWLRSLVQGHLSSLRSVPQRFYWVASGRVHIPRHTPQYKHLRTLQAQGLQGPLKFLDVCDALREVCEVA